MKRKMLVTVLIALVMALGLSGAAVAYATGGGLLANETESETPAAITFNEHENKFYALPNGKGWNDLKTAYENAINSINQEIKKIKDENGDLTEAVKNGRIPFYSKENDGYITTSNFESGCKYGEKWVNENVAQDALPVYRLTEGFAPSFRTEKAALVVFNAKATDTTGTNGVVFVTGDFAVKWSSSKGQLGLANGNTFKGGTTVYQNFQRGYLKKEGENAVELVKYKNVDSEGKEQAADLNELGWFGASGAVGGDKNKIGATTEDKVKEFAAYASAYYDELRKGGYNPGYPSENEVYFGAEQIRHTYKLTNFYAGDSVAKPWGDSRDNWTAIVLNENTKKLFLFKNDFLSAIEAKSAIEAFDNSGNSTGKGVGNPTSNDFAVNAHKARYQDFEEGYIKVNRLVPENKLGDEYSVSRSKDANYKPLKEMLTEDFGKFKNGEAKTAYDNERTYTAETYAAFKTEYDKTLGTDSGAEEIAAAYNALYDAFNALEISDPTAVLEAAIEKINAIPSNDNKIYTVSSYTAFAAAKTQALALPASTNEEKFAKIDAINEALALLVKFSDIVPSVTISKHASEFVASPNGKTLDEMIAAFNNAINEINKQIGYIMDGRELADAKADLEAAVKNGTIPFYSNAGGYIRAGGNTSNIDSFGEIWMSENARQNALMVYRLNDGEGTAGAQIHARDSFAAYMVLNAKATDFTGTNGVIFVTGNFVAPWNQKTLGMPNANAFTVNGVKYQNFQKGYLKVTGEDGAAVELVKYKNVKADGTEEAANMNVSGWYGAMGTTLEVWKNANKQEKTENYKNTLKFATPAEALAFSKAASAYYDGVIASGYNPGYTLGDLKDTTVFQSAKIRDKLLYVDNFYHGDSAAVLWEEARDNWTILAYNKELKKFFLIKDEIMYAMDKGDNDGGNYNGILDLGSPTSDAFAVGGNRYQTFANGYVKVNGLIGKNGCNGVSVFNKNSDGYKELTALLSEEYVAFRSGEAKTAFDKGESGFELGFNEFSAAYSSSPETAPSGLENVITAYNALYDAFAMLITAEVKAAYDEAFASVNAIVDNENYKYSAASFIEFEQAKAAALKMANATQDEMIAKTTALEAALALLESTEEAYNEIKAEIDLIKNGNNADKKYTDTSFAEFVAAYNAVSVPGAGDYEAMYNAGSAYGEAMELLVLREQMSDISAQGKTIEIGENYTVTVTGGDGNGDITIEIISGDAVTVSGNVVTAVKAGSVKLKITKAGGNSYFDKSIEITVTVEKLTPAAPASPEIEKVTANSITVKAIEGAEYRLGATGAWQKSNVFEGLTASTDYTVYVRFAETDEHNASGMVSVSATTSAGEEGCGCGSTAAADMLIVAVVLTAVAGALLVIRKKRA